MGSMRREPDRASEKSTELEQAYARAFFNVRQDDPRLYHIILDSTVCIGGGVHRHHRQRGRDRFGSIGR